MMAELSMHIMDIIENGISAGAYHIELYLEEYIDKDRIKITIIDNGKGMDAETLEKALKPVYSTKEGKGWGMGIPLFKQTVEHCEGVFKIESKKNMYTKVITDFQLNNIDRPPIGDIVGTIISIITGHPDIEMYILIKKDKKKYEFDTRIVREVLGEDISLATPQVLQYIKNDIKSGIEEIELID